MTRHTLTVIVEPAEDPEVPASRDEIVQQIEQSDSHGLDIVVAGMDGIAT